MAKELIYSVKSVIAVAVQSKLLLVAATGETRTSGWKNAALDPFMYFTPPADGIQEFNFVATPPTGISIPVLSPIAVEYVWENPPKWVKGVRVYSETNKKTAAIIKLSAAAKAKPAKSKTKAKTAPR